ncbi:hypothetical protein OBBRIDRAFT_494404 [Obba rivulosa]|uniref:Uncharacterized protein n=1 Tax=Obba rivulosa TaxID=1052685 RepID=A0A8E2AVN9_9APHY|nr:hypothetical protein OBBRIDRAFT_494404 [Obba rivulosa]
MPTFATYTTLRDAAEGFSLVLNARHVLAAGEPSEQVTTVKGRVPDNVDILLGSNLIFTLSGTLDRTGLTGFDMQQSAVAQHLLQYLKANSIELGLESFSDIYVDEADGIAKFSVTSAWPLRHDLGSPTVHLLALDLIYTCRSTLASAEQPAGTLQELSPFAPKLYLPFSTALHRITEKFASLHLVKRYPLIFGSWRAVSEFACPQHTSLSLFLCAAIG